MLIVLYTGNGSYCAANGRTAQAMDRTAQAMDRTAQPINRTALVVIKGTDRDALDDGNGCGKITKIPGLNLAQKIVYRLDE